MPLVIAVVYNSCADVVRVLQEPCLAHKPVETLACEVAVNAAARSHEEVDTTGEAFHEFDSEETVLRYKEFFEELGHTVHMIPGDCHLPERLAELRAAGTPVDICWNVSEGFRGLDRESQIPALLEMYGVPYSFGTPLVHALTLNKAMTKRIFAFHGIPTPAFQEFTRADEPLDPQLATKFPLFVKPTGEGSGIGVWGKSLAHNEEELRQLLREMVPIYRPSVLVEEFIPGRDITCGIIGNPRSSGGKGITVLEPNELDYEHYSIPDDMLPLKEKEGSLFYGAAIKGHCGDYFQTYCPAHLPEEVIAEVKRLTVAVYLACGGRDASRVDFRIDTRDGKLRPIVLEINTLPGMRPDSDLTICAAGAGLSHKQLVQSIFAAACDRYGLDHGLSEEARAKPNTPQ